MSDRLDKLLMVEKLSSSTNDYEYESPRWVLYCTVWGRIDPIRETERAAGEQMLAVASHKCLARYVPGVTSEMRISYQGRTFAISSVINLHERGEHLEMMLTETSNGS